MWKPEGGYPNMSCCSGEEVEDSIKQFASSSRQALGVTVHPSQYYTICKACKLVLSEGFIPSACGMKVLFVGGAFFEHITVLPICRVFLTFLAAKDVCKTNAAGILFEPSLLALIQIIELFSSSVSMKCTILCCVCCSLRIATNARFRVAY